MALKDPARKIYLMGRVVDFKHGEEDRRVSDVWDG